MLTFENRPKTSDQLRSLWQKAPARRSPGRKVIQPKLSVNTPGDRYELEADAIAEKVMRMKDDNPQAGESQELVASPLIQAKGDADNSVSPVIYDKIKASQGSGTTLDSNTQSFMSSRFGFDFSNVKIHTDNEAAWLNQEINARAFTLGNDIFFNAGQYGSGSESGKQLLAHELVHTLQQGNNETLVQREGEDPTNKDKPEIDYKILPPEFKLSIHHLIFKADTSQVQLDYKTRDMKAGLSYSYGGALSLGLDSGGTSASFGWTPGDNYLKFNLSRGSLGLGLTGSPEKKKFGASLRFGDTPLPPMADMSKTFMAGGTAGSNLVSGLGTGLQDPLAYYKLHKVDIESVSNSVDLVKKITDSGKKKIRFGGDFSLTYDPVSKVVFTLRVGGVF